MVIIYALAVCTPALPQISSSDYVKIAREKYNEGNFREVIGMLDQAIDEDSANDEAYFLKGLSYLRLESPGTAIENFTLAINHSKAMDRRLARYYLYRAVTRTDQSDYSSAEKDFAEAIRLNPSEAEFYFESSRLKFLTLGDKNAAISDLDWAIQFDPLKPRYYIKRAEYKVYQVRHNYSSKLMLESAIRDLTFAISLDTANYEYYKLRAELYKETGDPMLAVEDYTTLIRLNPDDQSPYQERGIIRMQYDDYSSAIFDFSTAIEKNPEEDKNFRYRALCKYNSSDYRGAYNDYTSAINILDKKLNNTNQNQQIRRILADAYIKRGVAAIYLGSNFNACMDFKNASDLGSSKGYNYLRKYCRF